MNHDNLLFYDVEVFPQDALIVLKNYENEVVGKFWCQRKDYMSGDSTGFEPVEELIKDKILVGYNNYAYDDYILDQMRNNQSCGWEWLKVRNDSLIAGNRVNNITKLHPSLDTFQQISLNRPSLKMIEGNMGKSIIESEIDFNHNEKLTSEERVIVEKYCEYDVENTIEVFKLRESSYFEPKAYLSEMTGSKGILRWNTTTIIANILSKDQCVKWDKHRVPEDLINAEWLPVEVVLMWKDMLKNRETVLSKGKNKKVTLFGCEFVFGMGGLHAAPKKPARYKNVKLADVGSMYPSIIVKLNGLDKMTEKYDGIRQERLRIKHTDKTRANALKLILNSTYGLFKNEYSTLYNPMASATVCVYGQIVLFRLCTMLNEAGYEIINVNTDGVAFVDDLKNRDEDYKAICSKWENEFSGLNLEIDEFDEWIQRDVNNYVAVHDGNIKVKGGDVNKYAKNDYFGNNNARIIHIAMVEKIVNGTSIAVTVNKHLDHPEEFQYILRPGSTFEGTCDENGNMMPQKVNRVFACKPNVHHTRLYKIRKDGGRVLYPDSPENMYVYNGDLTNMDNFRNIVDVNHYITIATKKLQEGRWP